MADKNSFPVGWPPGNTYRNSSPGMKLYAWRRTYRNIHTDGSFCRLADRKNVLRRISSSRKTYISVISPSGLAVSTIYSCRLPYRNCFTPMSKTATFLSFSRQGNNQMCTNCSIFCRFLAVKKTIWYLCLFFEIINLTIQSRSIWHNILHK
jgi:hypothetical protein